MIKTSITASVLLITVWGTTACGNMYNRTPQLKSSSQSALNQRFNDLDQWLSALHKLKRFNGSVLIADAEQIVFSESYGFDNIDGKRKLTENSSFNLASVSKQFTAAAILLLDDQDSLSVNDSLSEYIPELSFYSNISIEQLIHHTSGIADYMSLALDFHPEDQVFTTTDLIKLFSQHEPMLNFEPGTEFEYSNTGYVLLSEIVSRASGQSFEDYLQNQLFIPLSMQNTQVFNLLSTVEPRNRVYGMKNSMIKWGKRIANDLNFLDGVVGDGGVYSSTRDLFLWHQALLNEKLLPLDVYESATISGRLADGSDTDYGYGLVIVSDTATGHSGSWAGFATYFYRDTSTGLLIVILDNSTNPQLLDETEYSTSISQSITQFVKTLPMNSGSTNN